MARRRRTQARGRKPREGRLARSEVATLRLDPKLRYFVELAARKQRRTISSYLEWIVEQSLSQIRLTDLAGSPPSIADEAEQLWDVDKAQRFVKLAFGHPELLTHDEQTLWKLIRENHYVWSRRGEEQSLANMNVGRLRTYWDRFVAVARGEAEKSLLPGLN
jgi:hypothetical protein